MSASDGSAFNTRSKTETISPASPRGENHRGSLPPIKSVTLDANYITEILMRPSRELEQRAREESICRYSDIKDLTGALRTLRNKGNIPTLLRDEDLTENQIILTLRTNVFTDKEKIDAIKRATDRQLKNIAIFFVCYEENPKEFNRIFHERPSIFNGHLEWLRKTAEQFNRVKIESTISRIQTIQKCCIVTSAVACCTLGALTAAMINHYN